MKAQESKLTYSQSKTFGPKIYKENGKTYRITVKIRYDDECRNGHNTFAITADIDIKKGSNFYEDSEGCCHEEIAKHFPELKHLIKWHLVSSDGPLYYVANTKYNASNRDHWGKLKGEPYRFETRIFFNGVPIPFEYPEKFVLWLKERDYKELSVKAISHKPDSSYKFEDHYTFATTDSQFGFEWHECPFRNIEEAQNFLKALQTCKVKYEQRATAWGEGKERDFDAARSCAIWPEATEEELMSEDLEEKLKARLPKLMEEFKKDIEALGFEY